jgi:diadenosine tetraphosphate (Ap4A) HIT family hydrolase
MPHIISRQEAISKIEKEIPKGKCLACYLIENSPKYILQEGKHCTVLLSEYPRCWGQVMVIANRHVISFTELMSEEWTEISKYIMSSSKTIEKALKPLRCYVAATGATENMVMTSPHLHFNIIPVYHKTDKPSGIFTWVHGVYSGTAEEWEELYETLKSAGI